MQQIHWFPGHMAKARREITESLKKVDAVLELVDARLPLASANPMLRELIQNKPKIIVMTRSDMADEEQTKRWIGHFHRQGVSTVLVDARTGKGVPSIIKALEDSTEQKRVRDANRGIRTRAIRTLVAGIPNVGKSSLINRLAGRAATKIGDRPGITKSQQWIRLGNVELLDTPGILWPKLEDEAGAFKLAISGAIKSEILDSQSLFAYFAVWAAHHYPMLLAQRYHVDPMPAIEWTSVQEVWEDVEPLLVNIAKSRGFIRAGGVPDLERSADAVIRELQTGKVGRLSFEWAEELPTS